MEKMTLSENIIAVLDAACEKIGVVIDWTAENIVPEVQRLMDAVVDYELITSIVWLILSVIMIATAGLGYWRIAKCKREEKDGLFVDVRRSAYGKEYIKSCDINDFGLGFICISVFIIVIFGGVAVAQIMDIIKCCTIPEMVVVDYIKTYM